MRFFKMAKKKLSILIFIMSISFLVGGVFQVQANGLTAQEAQAIKLLNQDRTAQGLAALQVDMRLVRLGRQHAADMIERDYFAHNNPDGLTPFDRMKKAGIKYRAAAENIAMNYSVEKAQAALMESPGHRANILNEKYTNVGIGIAEKDDGALYLVQVFLLP